MSGHGHHDARQLRSRLGHPVIDADGRWVEYAPVMRRCAGTPRGLITEDDFRDFMFTNAVRFWGEVTPDFFRGTSVEKHAADVLAQAPVRA